MSGFNTPTTSVCAHLVKLYKILFRFSLGPIVSEKMKIIFSPQLLDQLEPWEDFFQLVYIFHRSEINLFIQWKQRSMTPGFCRGQILLMESAVTRRIFLQTIPTNTSLDPIYMCLQTSLGFLIDTNIKTYTKLTVVMWCQIFERKSTAPSLSAAEAHCIAQFSITCFRVVWLVRLGGSTS